MRAILVGGSACLLVACGAPNSVDPAQSPLAPLPEAGIATQSTKTSNEQVAERLPISDQSDFRDARRGKLGAINAPAILNEDGGVVWSIAQYEFLDGESPDTVNPSLWRQSQLAAEHGLFEIMDGLYQVRGYDLSVMSVIEGDTGWIIVDPLTSVETANAALRLVNETLSERPVTGMIYTHSHVDHFGGARGIIEEDEVIARNVPILAPIGFTENAVSENLIAGNHMSRRATLMFGNTIARNAVTHVGSGLGPGIPNGTISLMLPTEEIEGRSTERTIDGVLFEFIDAAGTEAPAEFMFYLPEKRALCTAEVATATFHNVLTPRGAKSRDALKWSTVIDYVLAEYGDRSDVVFASHHWPTWGQENVSTFLTSQRDIYRYVHDQALRRANAGASMTEAAEEIEEPSMQQGDFSTRGYYGTLNHNAKAVYQHYFGWWSGEPSAYHRLPRPVTAPRYVEAMGGADATLRLGIDAFEDGDYRWAAELLSHVVFADPENGGAKNWLAAAYEQMGFQAESGTWRSYYISAAAELRRGLPDVGNPQLGNADFLRAVPSHDLFNALAARYDPSKLSSDPFRIVFEFPDTEETITLHVGVDVIVPRAGADADPAATVRLDRADFDRLVLGDAQVPSLLLSGAMALEGDTTALANLFGALEQPPFWFNIVTP